jgi:enediyne biosynthesis protein E4
MRVVRSPIRLLALASCLSLEACHSTGGAPSPSMNAMKAFWVPLDLKSAVDLGFAPRRLAASEIAPAGMPTFANVSAEAGLGGSIAIGNPQGVGLAFVDVNGDGFADVFVANGRSVPLDKRHGSALFLNDGHGRFADATERAGLAFLADKDAYSVAAGDYDNDGDLDLYLATHPHDVLLQNRGDGTFVDATAAAGAGGPTSSIVRAEEGRSKIVGFGDYDGDGWLDIVASSSTLEAPFAYLLHNRGDGTFADVTDAMGVKAQRKGNPCAMMWSDYDNDGDRDLWIWNDFGDHILLRNEAGARFTDVTEESKLADKLVTNPMGIDAADLDHDGDLDYYISNAGDNPLLYNNGDGTFSDETRRAGTGGEFGWGLGMRDFDADGFTDLFVAQEDQLPVLVFRNEGGDAPKFSRIELAVPQIVDVEAARNTPVAFADYDHDGRIDALVARTDGEPLILYRNTTDLGSRRWLEVEISRAPKRGDKGAIGARIGVKIGDLVQFTDITGGSSRASQNELIAHFGLGDWTGAEWVAVLWPGGEQKIFTNVEANRRLVVDPP